MAIEFFESIEKEYELGQVRRNQKEFTLFYIKTKKITDSITNGNVYIQISLNIDGKHTEHPIICYEDVLYFLNQLKEKKIIEEPNEIKESDDPSINQIYLVHLIKYAMMPGKTTIRLFDNKNGFIIINSERNDPLVVGMLEIRSEILKDFFQFNIKSYEITSRPGSSFLHNLELINAYFTRAIENRKNIFMEYPKYLENELKPFNQIIQAEIDALTDPNYKPKFLFNKISFLKRERQDVSQGDLENNQREKSDSDERSDNDEENRLVVITVEESNKLNSIFKERDTKLDVIGIKNKNYESTSIKNILQDISQAKIKEKVDFIRFSVRIDSFEDTEDGGKLICYDVFKPEYEEIRFGVCMYSSSSKFVAFRKLDAMRLIMQPYLTPLQNLVDLMVRPDVFTSFEINKITPINRNISPEIKSTKSQFDALCKMNSCPDLTIIQGPPGAGKTTMIIEIIKNYIRQNKRVLMVAPTHVAVDNIIERLDKEHDPNLHMVRVGRSTRIPEEYKKYMLDEIKKYYLEFINQDFLNYYESESERKKTTELQSIQKEFFTQLKEQRLNIEDNIINSANLVCGTTTGVVSIYREAKNIQYFDLLVLDESSKTTMLDFLIPATRAKKWLILGDQNQLPPYINDEELKIFFDKYLNLTIEEQLREELNQKALNQLKDLNKKNKETDIFSQSEVDIMPVTNYVIEKFRLIYEQMHIIGTNKKPDAFDEWNSLCDFFDNQLNIIRIFKRMIRAYGSCYHYFYDQLSESRKHMLDYQYRMPPIVADFISENVYEGKLKSADRTKKHGLKIDLSNMFHGLKLALSNMVFISTSELDFKIRKESKQEGESSYYNELEADIIIEIIKEIHRSLISNQDNIWMHGEYRKVTSKEPISVGIISFYGKQANIISKKLKETNLPFIKRKGSRFVFTDFHCEIVNSIVDRFQGQEKDIIIIPFTRSNQNGNVGFLKVMQRINVAISRVKHNLFLVGDSNFLRSNKNSALLRELVNYCKNKNLIVYYTQRSNYITKVVIDGSNVCNYKKEDRIDKKPSLKNLVEMVNHCKKYGYDVSVIIGRGVQEELKKNPEYTKYVSQLGIHESPYREDDDLYVLQLAEKINAYIISNDHFKQEKYKKFQNYVNSHLIGYIIKEDRDKLVVITSDLQDISKERKFGIDQKKYLHQIDKSMSITKKNENEKRNKTN